MSVLTTEQIKIVKDLILNNSVFWNAYQSIILDKKEPNIFILFSLIKNERTLLRNLNLNSDTASLIEDWILDNSNYSFEGDILTNYARLLDEKSYPYYRLIARIRHCMRKTIKKGSFDNLLIENEVLAIFKGLRESEYYFPTIQQELRQSAFNFLICSPEAELKIILNSFNPVSKFDDFIDLTAELDILEVMIKNYQIVKEYEKISFERSSDKMQVRTKRFNENFFIIISKINEILAISCDEDEVRNNLEFIVLIEQIKALLLSLKKSERYKCYSKILESPLFSYDSKFYDFMINILKEVFVEIEKMSSNVRYFTMVPKKGGQ